MQVVAGVQSFQCVEQRPQQFVKLGLPRRPVQTGEPTLEALPVLEVQHHVCGAVGAEIAVDAIDVRVVELGERLRLVDEAGQAPVVVLLAVCRLRPDRRRGIAHGKIAREVFLDGDEAVERDFAR